MTHPLTRTPFENWTFSLNFFHDQYITSSIGSHGLCIFTLTNIPKHLIYILILNSKLFAGAEPLSTRINVLPQSKASWPSRAGSEPHKKKIVKVAASACRTAALAFFGTWEALSLTIRIVNEQYGFRTMATKTIIIGTVWNFSTFYCSRARSVEVVSDGDIQGESPENMWWYTERTISLSPLNYVYSKTNAVVAAVRLMLIYY